MKKAQETQDKTAKHQQKFWKFLVQNIKTNLFERYLISCNGWMSPAIFKKSQSSMSVRALKMLLRLLVRDLQNFSDLLLHVCCKWFAENLSFFNCFRNRGGANYFFRLTSCDTKYIADGKFVCLVLHDLIFAIPSQSRYMYYRKTKNYKHVFSK